MSLRSNRKNIILGAALVSLLLFSRRGNAVIGNLVINNIVDDLPVHPTEVYPTRTINQITQIVIHHSLTTSGSPYAYATYHIDENNWAGIGYTYVIQRDGTIYQTNYWETISNHASGANTNSISICLTGNLDIQFATAAQMNSLRQLTKAIQNEFNWGLSIHGHNEFSDKTCPGLNFSVEDLKNSIYA